jgi:NADH-quinone oxidoreductase subunit J
MDAGLIAAESATFNFTAFFWQALQCPTAWGILLGIIALWLLIPTHAYNKVVHWVGCFSALLAGILLAYDMPRYTEFSSQAGFWVLAVVTLGSGVAMISARNPVYSALWFALSLLGTSGLYLVQGAQFIGMATIVVYAGAIVVTFLFVIMLAQPEGHAAYDRISWGKFPKPAALIIACLFLGLLMGAIHPWQGGTLPGQSTEQAQPLNGGASMAELQEKGVLHSNHMAHLGRELFSRQLIAVEVAGTLLMAALVGAIAIALHGKQTSSTPLPGSHAP